MCTSILPGSPARVQIRDDRLVGAVEGKYPERKAAGFGHDPETTLVRGIMVNKAYYCFENQSADEAREIMCEDQLEYLPVVDDNMRVIGIVALRDLAAEHQRRNHGSVERRPINRLRVRILPYNVPTATLQTQNPIPQGPRFSPSTFDRPRRASVSLSPAFFIPKTQ